MGHVRKVDRFPPRRVIGIDFRHVSAAIVRHPYMRPVRGYGRRVTELIVVAGQLIVNGAINRVDNSEARTGGPTIDEVSNT